MRYRFAAATCLFSLSIAMTALADDVTLSGKRALNKDTVISATTITFKPDALIVTNGFKLTIEAGKLITLEGTPNIVSFEQRAGRPAGDPGRSAGPIIIGSPALAGNILKIENTGENGMNGADGATGQQGPNGRQGTQRDWNPWNGCIGGSNGTPGGQGGDGGNGGLGGNGGTGGTVIVDIKGGFSPAGTPRLDMIVTGGQAGMPGAPGGGGPGGQGGAGAPGTAYCGGTDAGPSGPTGRPGLQGIPGAPGNAGLIIDVNQNSHPANLTEREKALYKRGIQR
jgi:hypothetical protein